MRNPEHRQAAKQIDVAIAREEWDEARTLIRRWLRHAPDDHWLLARLSLTYYEQKQYGKALKYAAEALQTAPNCPLSIWDYAGALDMLGQSKKALVLYAGLIRRGEEKLAYGECGEGIQWARSLIADCHYR